MFWKKKRVEQVEVFDIPMPHGKWVADIGSGFGEEYNPAESLNDFLAGIARAGKRVTRVAQTTAHNTTYEEDMVVLTVFYA